ncbi:MAG TPA: SDR family NAD(P)-dependent oxidoreductase [Gemmatimonadaceae bacterium]
MSPSDRLAIVTGSSSGIGFAVTALLLQHGWDVVGVARRNPVVTNPGYRHLTLDLGDLAATTATFEREVASLVSDDRRKRVALVNNAAAIGRAATLDGTNAADLLALYAVNVVAPIWLMGFVMRHARRDCVVRMVNVSSGAAVQAMAGIGEYCGTKAALRMASMVAAADLGSEPLRSEAATDIAVLSYAPGVVDTAMQTLARAQPAATFPASAMFWGFKEQGLLVKPEVPAAEVVAFLESANQPPFVERRLGEE